MYHRRMARHGRPCQMTSRVRLRPLRPLRTMSFIHRHHRGRLCTVWMVVHAPRTRGREIGHSHNACDTRVGTRRERRGEAHVRQGLQREVNLAQGLLWLWGVLGRGNDKPSALVVDMGLALTWYRDWRRGWLEFDSRSGSRDISRGRRRSGRIAC